MKLSLKNSYYEKEKRRESVTKTVQSADAWRFDWASGPTGPPLQTPVVAMEHVLHT